ncbi:30S ribosomal protein S21, chloroplastic [Ipomoea triloba]|uniref:30S ribosomal protein S21, chloroplastic n=1 Tax=Ipomoea triloba TaxID=35885 RepID=UPI00125D614C|nr:30S ribosomal protein S21, chloroplastic [Ipomoea triloba]
MAAASSIATLFSFFSPSKPPSPKAPPLQLSLSSDHSSSISKSHNDGWAPLVKTADNQKPYPSPLSGNSELMSVVCPSLAHANTLFFSSYNVELIVDGDEPEERLLNRFRREVMKTGLIQECKRRRYFENKQEEKKRKSREAARRNRRRRRGPFEDRRMASANNNADGKKEEDDDDNWELPDRELPF